ncbi:MAG: acyl-CoA dehydrogenase, partial [Thermoleophilaceae bacterium]|nr:acyl-CoA dehydrogenase [Thermoleophilaceae bacterium]
MDFSPSPRVEELRGRIAAFLDEHVYPVELEALHALDEEVREGVPYPRVLVELRERAKADGLWNLFLPGEEHGGGLTNWEYG